MRRLPPLNGLRAFEAAARRGSFASAGQELNVTQAAISRMVRVLEERLGYRLFERHANTLVLTWQGRTLQPGLTAAFNTIASLAEQVAMLTAAPALTVGVGPSFAMRWLIPRLGDFHASYPDIEVRIATGGAMNPIRDDWSCGIRLGDGRWPGYESEPLFSADLFPVCAPGIARQLRSLADLRGQTLLQVEHAMEDWPSWLRAAGIKWRPDKRSPRFDNYAMALQAAVDGVGVAMGLAPYVADDLAAKRLIAPFALKVPKGHAWYLIWPSSRVDDTSFAAFRTWLVAQVR
ncbi:MAG TPA: transcriptional regulator GcvA [Casimicrobiaceae bacterium]|nr:transcriptional regulator GcvA [Casimicrobiaceae bacterium]